MTLAENRGCSGGPGLRGVEDEDDQIGAGHFLAGPRDAGHLQWIVSRAQAGRVGQFDGPAVECCAGGHGVAGCAGLMVNDRALEAEQPINQAAFSDVRRPGQHNAPWFD